MSMRTSLYCLDSSAGYPDWAGGEYSLLGSVLISAERWKHPLLSHDMTEALTLLRRAMVVGDELQEFLETVEETETLDDREVDRVKETSHVLELIFRDPRVPWLAVGRGQWAVEQLQRLCRDPELVLGLAKEGDYAFRKLSKKDVPQPLTAASPAVLRFREELLDELETLHRDLGGAIAAGAQKLLLDFQ